MSQGNTYSFKDLVGSLTNDVFGVSLPLTGGNVGLGRVTITMTTERSAQDVAADGTVMPSYIAGANGDVDIEVQQTSDLHHALLDIYNQAVLAADNDDLIGWAATIIAFRTILDGSTHILTGVSFQKVPEKPYQANGQKVTWKLMACDVQNL